MPQLAMQELDDGIRQALPVVHLEASEVMLSAQICGDSQSVGCGTGGGDLLFTHGSLAADHYQSCSRSPASPSVKVTIRP